MAVSIDAQAAINEIARDLDRGVDGYRAEASPDPVIGFSSPSTQFGDEEFVHEIGMYGASDPILRASLRAFGADPARFDKFSGAMKPDEFSEMASPFLLGQSHGFNPFVGRWVKNPTAKFNQAYVSGSKKWGQPVVDREFINNIYRHEYRHLGLDLIQSNQNRKFGLAGFDYPIDKSLRKAFSPHSLVKNTFPLNFIYGMKYEQDKANEEAYMRYLDTKYAQGAQAQKSRDWLNNMIKQGQVKPNWDYIENVLNPSLEKQIATATYKNNFPAQPKQGLLNDPASWLTRLLFGDK